MKPQENARIRLWRCALTMALFFCALPGSAMEISSLKEKIAVESSGTAIVEMKVTLSGAESGNFLLPRSFKSVEDLKIDGLPEATASAAEDKGVRVFAIKSNAAPADDQAITLSFKAPGFYDWEKEKVANFGNRNMQYRFMNTLPTKIQSYKLDLALPQGYVVNTVVDSQPKFTSKSPTSPYQITQNDERAGISIKASKLGVGDYGMVNVRFKEGGQSILLLIGGLLLCGLYLVGYRDTVRPSVAPA